MQRRTFFGTTMLGFAGLAAGMASGVSVADSNRNKRPTAHDGITGEDFPFVQADARTRLFYKDWPALGGSEPTVARTAVFVHGWALNSEMWQYQMQHLSSQGVRVIAYDRRGHGRSSDPGSGYDCDRLADDLAAVLEALALRDVVLVGHSMGCAEIVRYLTRHGGDRVARVAMVGPSLPFTLKTEDNPEGVEKSALLAARHAIASDFPRWLTENAPPFFRPETTPRMVEWGIGLCYQASMRALIATSVTDSETDFRAELQAIRKRVLILHGDSDRSAPLEFTARRTVKLIPGAELRVYEGAPHGLFITHMERLNRDLLEFIQA